MECCTERIRFDANRRRGLRYASKGLAITSQNLDARLLVDLGLACDHFMIRPPAIKAGQNGAVAPPREFSSLSDSDLSTFVTQ